MGRCRDTSWQGKGKDQLRFGKRERLTNPIVVEPVLSKEHFPKVLANLIPCLCSCVIRVVNLPFRLTGEKRPFGTHLAGLPYAQNRGCDQWTPAVS